MVPGALARQYATDVNLAARQRLWQVSPRRPEVHLYSWVVGLARLDGTERVLEVGCGNGGYLELVDAIGMDLSPGMLAAARARTTAPLVCGDAQRIPARDGAFDVVLAPHMLYHVPDRRAAAIELRRVTRPGGVCIAVTNGTANHRSMVRLVEDVVGGGWRWHRPSVVAFSMENGAAQLAVGFESVTRIDCPPVVVSVTDADALADYLASVGDHYEDEIDRPWADVVAECRARVAAVIARDGAFRIDGAMGAFLCQ